jgi:DMSO/TMAO reductase YedYZ molybdopterin-dependent catalytic subunit
LPPPDVAEGAVDPGQAYREATDAGLLIRSANPLNGETHLSKLAEGEITPNRAFYIRNHFAIPDLNGERYRLSVSGLVERPLSVSLSDLHKLPSECRIVTLECAGNGRSFFSPAVAGEHWDLGATSTAEWTGVRLIELLERAGVQPGASEVIFRGADGGQVGGVEEPIRFERSLSLNYVRGLDPLLADSMNGEPLPVPHGYPLRLIVPGWYAVASVKWLTEIEVTDRPFDGYFQTTKYWYEWMRDGRDEREPVTHANVRALIVAPQAGTRLARGETAIRGLAWSGAGGIAKVEVSLNGDPWREARMIGAPRDGAWQWWELHSSFDQLGPLTIRARATDMAGRTQPDEAEWNRLGYGNNSVHAVLAHVV